MTESMPSRELALDDLRWLRALASRLVRDPGRADDAVQETVVRALERGPREPGALRAWLATILRNALRQDARGRVRREQREAARPGAADAPSTLDVVAELALHRRLVEHVDALEEPYRTAIVLRFLRERAPADAARELGVPVKTFHTRVERGLATLRERLGRDREAWVVALALHPPSPAPLAAGLAPLVLTMKLKLSAVLVALLLACLWWRWPRAESAAPEIAAPSTAPAMAPSEEVAGATTAVRAGATREPSLQPPVATRPTAPTPAVASPPVLRGSVRALDGSGLAGLRVRFVREVAQLFVPEADDPLATSGAQGAFELPRPAQPGRLTVDDETFAALVQPRVDASPPLAEPVVVVVPARDFDGRVVDERGHGIAGATVEITLGGSFVQSIDVGDVSVHFLLPFAETKTDGSGAFRFAHVAAAPEAMFAVSADGYASRNETLPDESTSGLEILLRRAADRPRTLHGLVVDSAGAPVEGAQVALGDQAVVSDRSGRFALECPSYRERGTLRAVKPGALPAELRLDPLPFDADGTPHAGTAESPLVLELGAEPRTIQGRVLDAAGEPVAGALVFSPDTTPFGAVLLREGEHTLLGGTTVEALLDGRVGPAEASLRARSDAHGRFELRGLVARSYALFALDPRTLAGSGRVDVRGGEADARLVLAPVERRAVSGRVLSRRGVPLADVRVTLGRAFPWRSQAEADAEEWAQLPRAGTDASSILDGPSATTDADGRFALEPIAIPGSFLVLRGRAIVASDRVALDDVADLTALEVRADASSRFAIVLADPSEADSFSLETAAGELVPLFIEVDGAVISSPNADVAAGRSGPVLVREGEWVVVLHSLQGEVRRRTLDFPAGGLHELRP